MNLLDSLLFVMLIYFAACISEGNGCNEDTKQTTIGSNPWVLEVIFKKNRNYTDAATFCRNQNSSLASINTDKLLKDLRSLLGDCAGWVGGKYTNGQWRWEDGSEFDEQDNNNSNIQTNKRGMCVEASAEQQWTSLSCNKGRRFICQRDPCSSNPCKHDGKCSWSDKKPYYTCNCRPEFNGTTCQNRIFVSIDSCKYHLNQYDSLNFQGANSVCSSVSATLAMLTSSKNENIQNQMKQTYPSGDVGFWIGAERNAASWQWLDSTTISNVVESAGGDCLRALKIGDAVRFRTSLCNDKTNGFICEKPEDGSNPCSSQTCNDNGKCIAIGCHYKCNCTAGYSGKDCAKDQMKLSTTEKLYVKKVGTVNVTIDIETEDFPVDIDFCHGSADYSVKISNVTSKTTTQAVGPINATTITICTIQVSSKVGGYHRNTFVSINVFAPPKITDEFPDSVKITKNYVECFASGQPQPSITWYKTGERIKTSNTGGVYQNGDKLFLNGHEEDAGNYTCRASNKIIVNNLTTEYEDEKNLFVRVPLSQVSSLETQEEFVENARFICVYRANPKPAITWQFVRDSTKYNITSGKGSIFTITSKTDDTGVTPVEESSLKIRLADCLGPVKIKCVAKNSYEAKNLEFQLNKRVRLLHERRYLFTNGNYTHDEAMEYCSKFDSNLTGIRDVETQMFFRQWSKALLASRIAYTGGTESKEDGNRVWRWSSGDFFYNFSEYGSWKQEYGNITEGKYLSWNEGKPADDPTKKCLHLMKSDERNWSNAKCEAKMAAICEKSRPILASFSATPDNCSPTIIVTLKPEKFLLGIRHKIEVESFGTVSDQEELVTEDKTYRYEFRNLSRTTKYNVTVRACPEVCLCRFTREVQTRADIPGEVRLANVSQKEKGALCVISWSKPLKENEIEYYKITVKSEIAHYLPDEEATFFNDSLLHSEFVLQHNYPVQPNRNYTFSIQAALCAGVGKAVVAEGSCLTEREAPSAVAQPALNSPIKDGSLDVTFSAISESNGPISCLLIVVVKNPESEGVVSTEFSQERLQTASISGMENMKSEYIALALARNQLQKTLNNDEEVHIKLGDNQSTSCDVSIDPTVIRQRREVTETILRGRNDRLDETQPMGIIVVAATPVGNGEVHYRSSNMTTYKPVAAPVASNWWIALVVTLIAVVLICVAIALVYLKRRKDSLKNGDINSHVTDVPMASIPISNTDEPMYANLANENTNLRTKTDIPIERLESVYNSMKANDNREFAEEYQALKHDAQSIIFSKTAAARPSVKKKNRYKNILPYDSTRVKLSGDGSDSYINASYIEGYHHANKFIATQGPLSSTINDFWRMVVEHKCRIIVMLTKCFEKGKKKCEKYWPNNRETAEYGKVTVHNLEENSFGGFVKTKLRINSDTGGQFYVIHFQALKWPDHGVPIATSSFFRIYHAVIRCHEQVAPSAPVIVHCSAGAGRTGAFVAYDYLTNERNDLKQVDVYNCVLNMRKQRVDMVQNADQYIFVHKLILEDHLFGSTEMTANEVSEVLRQEDGRIALQFKNLSTMLPIHTALLHGTDQNTQNLKSKILPYAHSKVIIKRTEQDLETPFINASFLETFDESYSLIAAQGPVKASIENFWRAAFDNDVTIIVALTGCVQDGKEQCTRYWPCTTGDLFHFNNISVKMRAENTEGHITVREFQVTERDEKKKIIQYHYEAWPDSTCPSDPKDVLAIINKMQREVRPNEKVVTLVHCSDGAGRTGAFCAVVNLLERQKCEGVVDVFREVKDLRDCRPGMVATLDQYLFCFRAVEAFIEGSNVYVNMDVRNEEKLYENWQ